MQATRATHLALFVLAASVLMLEVALTRIFSVLLWNHYTFLVISTALLGFGAAGSFLAVRRTSDDEADVRRFLARNCVAFAVATVLCAMAVTRLGIEPVYILVKTTDTLKLVGIYVLTAAPFFFAGLAICRLLTVYAKQINTVYFADLVGAGAGALGVTILLDWIGAPATILACSALASAAGAIFAGRRHVAVVAWPAVFAAASALVYAADPWEVPPPLSKPLHGFTDKIDYTRWSLHARLDVLESESQPLSFGSGVSKSSMNRAVEYRTFLMDGSNPSRLIKAGQDEWFLTHVLTASPYQVAPVDGEVLIIGAGGGIDVKVALHHGAKHVTALEINPATVELVREVYDDYIGHLFTRPEVTLLAEEGRHYLTLDREKKYDVIRLTGVDTRASAASGANSLDHAFLYTVEAIRDLYHRLDESGIVAISRQRQWQTERLLSIMVAALERGGHADPASRIAVVFNGRWCDVLLRRKPFSREEVEGLTAWADGVGLEVLYDPFTPRENELTHFLKATPEQRAAILATAEENLKPVTDDSPFFFEPLKLGTAVGNLVSGRLKHTPHSGYLILIVTMIQAVVFSTLFILLPLARRREGVDAQGRGWTIAYFSLLGLGFIMAELVFIQKYTIVLGGPSYAMAVGLFSILIFSGLGAFASRRIPSSRKAVYTALSVIVLLLFLQGLFLRFGLPRMLEYGHTARMALSVLSLAPVSFALGWPFPIGVRLLQERSPGLVPWAWASNACLTVVGSVFCLIASMNWGFLASLGIAALCYLAAAASTAAAPIARSAGTR